MTTPAPGKGGRDQHSATTTKADRDVTATASSSVPPQLRRRRVASWRCEPLADGRRDPLDPVAGWSDSELESWAVAAAHLCRLKLPAVVPDSVRVAWYRRRCQCRCRDAS